MSDLLNQASLVMVPSGYKEDVVYSQIPTSGAGDLSFTRASNGTRINSAGLVEVTPWNELTYSEDFTNAAWPKLNATVTANTTTAPNGTTTASKLVEDSQLTVHLLNRSGATVGTQQILSIYAKASERSQIAMQLGTSIAYYNLSNGTIVSGSGATIENVGNGWYRCAITTTPTNSNTQIYLAINGVASYQGNGTSGVFLWGAQLNIGSTAKPYFPTTDRLNVPRLTYQNGGGGCPSLLLEPQRTNILLNSDDLNSWLKLDTSVTSNSTTSPDGTQNADTVTATGSGSLQHLIYQNLAFTSGTAYTMSVFAKANTSNFIQLVFAGDFINNNYANFNLSNGTITASAFVTAKIENYGNGWYRCSISATAGTSNTNSQIFYLINSGTASRGQSFTANGESVYLWGGQFEAGAYPTSYIPTTSSSATRVIDDCRKTGISSLIGQSEGTMFIDLNLTAWDSDSFYFGLYGGGNEIYFRCGGSGVINFFHYFGSTQALITKSGLSLGRHKLAACYKNNDWAFYVDGILVGTDTSGTFSGTISQMVFGYTSISAYPPFQSVNQTILFPTRLTNAELASLTTI